jgi:hypothetical protein
MREEGEPAMMSNGEDIINLHNLLRRYEIEYI